MNMNRRKLLATLLAASAAGTAPWTAAWGRTREIEVWRGPQCGCCELWIEHLKQAGFSVKEHLVDNTAPWRQRLGIPVHLGSCHSARVEGYSIEGHVPAQDIVRLLAERPKAVGLTVPYMPIGSPGMEVEDGRRQAYDVLLLKQDGSTQSFKHYPAIAPRKG